MSDVILKFIIHDLEKEFVMDNNYNVLDVIDELMSLGYTEEHAEEVAMYCNYNVPLENMFDN